MLVNIFFRRDLIAPQRQELLPGLICWFYYQLLAAPLSRWIIGLLDLAPGSAYGHMLLQLLYLGSSFVLCLVLLKPFLWRSVLALRGRVGALLGRTVQAYLAYYLMSFFLGWLLQSLALDFRNYNNDAVTGLVHYMPLPTLLCALVLAPITEELLLRGLIFAPLCRKSPLLAYAVSSLIFAFLHVQSFLGLQPLGQTLLVMLQYLPAGIALGWCYQATGSVVGPMALHLLVNGISALVNLA